MLIDSHAHLTADRFDRDRDKIIKSFAKDGIEMVITAGSSFLSSAAAVSLAEKHKNIYATVGIHPCCAGDVDEGTIQVLKALSNHKKVIAIGEIGLDYHHNIDPKEVQKKWFIEQIKLAIDVDLPIVIHDRKANTDTFEIVKAAKEKNSSLRGVLHCFSGDLELAREYIKLGFYISISPPVTYRSARMLKEVAKEIPLEYLFIETDCPSLPPGQIGKRRNEPAFVRYVASEIAELKEVSFETVAKETGNNVKRLFNIR